MGTRASSRKISVQAQAWIPSLEILRMVIPGVFASTRNTDHDFDLSAASGSVMAMTMR